MKQFVYPANAIGEAVREITREIDLQVHINPSYSDWKNGLIGINYEIQRIPNELLHLLYNPKPSDWLLRATDAERVGFFNFGGGNRFM